MAGREYLPDFTAYFGPSTKSAYASFPSTKTCPVFSFLSFMSLFACESSGKHILVKLLRQDKM